MNNTDSLLYNYIDELGYDVVEIFSIEKNENINLVHFSDKDYGFIKKEIDKEHFKNYLRKI
jgi:hypothetical protein